ncbi:MAG: DUF364 domain-containing protein [Archaeoglobaceae archaeon]
MNRYDEICRKYFRKLVDEKGIKEENISSIGGIENTLNYRTVSPEWFMLPSEEYAISKGEEKVMECNFRNSKAQVFTTVPSSISLKVSEVLELNLQNIASRSLFYCALNAVMVHYGLVSGTVHCRKDSPLECAKLLFEKLKKVSKLRKILLIGYQPAFAEKLSEKFDLFITDMNPKNINRKVRNTKILSHLENLNLIPEVDIVLITGSSLINGTFWELYECAMENSKPLISYGISASGASKILGIERHCPLST